MGKTIPTHLELAEMFTNTTSSLKYCLSEQKWYVYDDNKGLWVRDGKDCVKACRRLLDYVYSLDEHVISEYSTFKKLSAVLRLIATFPNIHISVEQFDQHKHLLNAPNGVVNLHTGQIMVHDPKYLFTKTTSTTPAADKIPIRFLSFLNDSFGDVNVISFLQVLFGYMCSGEVSEKIVPFFIGKGNNGKTVLAELISTLLGDYAGAVPSSLYLRNKKVGEHDYTTLESKRFGVGSEVPPDAFFDEEKIKKISGMDSIATRKLYEEYRTMRHECKVLILANSFPDLKCGDEAFWNRIRIVRFTKSIPLDKQNKNLFTELLQGEGEAILGWIVSGAVKYYSEGLTTPSRIFEDTKSIEENHNHVKRFINTYFTITESKDNKVKCDIVRKLYDFWCDSEDIDPLESRMLGKELVKIGVTNTRYRDNGVRVKAYTNLCFSSKK